ncbi:hypothetical protein ACEWY4_000144 [Coilia grayii]|uniref:TNFR-Cys domain-containing protein n=1 Tax=Coilia grayii TaxID=363190 RepID=A0ABD1KWE2_9TELE
MASKTILELPLALILALSLPAPCGICLSQCSPAEYEVMGGCCPMCSPGAGLRIKRNCSSSSDTLCEPLEGHYCTDPIKDGCRGAVEHTKCLPGQYINQPGSASSDTVCDDCGNNTYSDGTFTSCRPHTQCVSLGLWTRTAGTHTADAECEMRRHHVVLWVQLATFCIAAVVLLACWHRKRS